MGGGVDLNKNVWYLPVVEFDIQPELINFSQELFQISAATI